MDVLSEELKDKNGLNDKNGGAHGRAREGGDWCRNGRTGGWAGGKGLIEYLLLLSISPKTPLAFVAHLSSLVR